MTTITGGSESLDFAFHATCTEPHCQAGTDSPPRAAPRAGAIVLVDAIVRDHDAIACNVTGKWV